jgi:hypothetical protein
MKTGPILLILLVTTALGHLSAQETKACKLIPRAEAAQILGKPEVATAKVLFDDDNTCNYRGVGFHLEVEEIPDQALWSAGLKSLIKKKEAEAESGIGDEALYTEREGDPAILARKGTHWVTVTLYRNWGGKPDQVRPTLRKLARAAVTKLH